MSLCPHGYTAFWDCPTCEEPMGTKPIAPPELDFCSACHEHADYEWHEDEGAWLSTCCTAKATPCEAPSWMEDR